MDTNMRTAFLEAEVPKDFDQTKLGRRVIRVAQSQAGVQRTQKEFGASLTHKTAMQLIKMGIIPDPKLRGKK